jgi:hypothetical protein
LEFDPMARALKERADRELNGNLIDEDKVEKIKKQVTNIEDIIKEGTRETEEALFWSSK